MKGKLSKYTRILWNRIVYLSIFFIDIIECKHGKPQETKSVFVILQQTYGFADGDEAMTEPSSCRSIAADVGKASVMISVWCAK